jgi:excisionase family DNA binding protein
MHQSIFPGRINATEAAKILGVSVDTLAVWRCTKRYPLPYIKMGRKVFYRAADLEKFIESRTIIMDQDVCR